MLSAVVAAVSLFSSVMTPNSLAPPSPPPERVTIDVVTVNGSGCPPGSSAVAVAKDNSSFTVTYSEYTAQVGVGAKPTDIRKNCQLNLNIHVPQGFTYGIASADYRGFAQLESGAKASQRANYYFQGNSPTAHVSHPLSGPVSDNWQFRDEAEGGVIIYKPCGEDRNLNVNTELRVAAGTSDPKKTTSFITMDSTDGAVKTTYQFSWKTCPTS